ncbi:hypothetical protein CKSOR_00121 [Candidatus Kinetoplastibacterium sorsogonicusi]|uniref:Protein translocase subunit SecD n=1 Tax=Candidatus Kinetoplastidibacterium kentomonadis TaxID=1576550 RepID=A0A3Q8ETY1_9PROT|nr:protein translocase subunit SecD [Candidatus Kinetoplastibacterium sorsogonicusi]AWD32257.1 hypothetical protein CKSOR_00121 [Candidatus Kinetoplastibacterium sorsogonicusi]
MNRYPTWKYILVLLSIIISTLYVLPTFCKLKPSIQITSNNSNLQFNNFIAKNTCEILKKNNINVDNYFIYNKKNSFIINSSITFCFENEDDRNNSKSIIENELSKISYKNCNISFINAPSLPKYMNFLYKIGAKPISLGLDLKGGVHFLLEMDFKPIIENSLISISNEIKKIFQEKNINFKSIEVMNLNLIITLNNLNDYKNINTILSNIGLESEILKNTNNICLKIKFNDNFFKKIKNDAIKQNIDIIHKRVNELGVSEPIIQQQNLNRIIVQLPGIHDIVKAKEILGRIAALEIRMVEDDITACELAKNGFIPVGSKMYNFPDNSFILVKNNILLTGKNIKNAFASYDKSNALPIVHIVLDDIGTKIFKNITRENLGKRLAIILVDEKTEELITAPVIKSEISEGQVQISGSMNSQEAYDMALLLRSGSLSTPMNIIEEKNVGPTLGEGNIQKGCLSTIFGFSSIIIFIVIYYRLFGFFSAIGLTVNLLLMLSVLSILQATLTLPGISALALNLGMAIDSNVLINERIREELRSGSIPEEAISKGFALAWNTILDSNLTALIIGMALLSFTSGPIRGFAVVHCLGVLTSMFSSVIVVRALVNIWYGYRKNLSNISIGTIWYKNKK